MYLFPRGLCRKCYFDPTIRPQYPAKKVGAKPGKKITPLGKKYRLLDDLRMKYLAYQKSRDDLFLSIRGLPKEWLIEIEEEVYEDMMEFFGEMPPVSIRSTRR